MDTTINCPKCGAKASTSGNASCFCDKDNCFGQRCGANDIPENYSCECGASGITPEAEAYYRAKMKD